MSRWYIYAFTIVWSGIGGVRSGGDWDSTSIASQGFANSGGELSCLSIVKKWSYET
jgi:hypothetical protein